MSQHHFDIEHAKQYGVGEAIVINCFQFWIELNAANGRNQHDGRTWTYNSVNALSELFPYWTAKQIRRIMGSLEKQSVLITGNYNDKAYDKTKWFAFVDESKFLKPSAQKGKGLDKSLCPKGQMDMPKRANGYAQKGKPIPVNNTVNNTVNNIDTDFEKFWNLYDYKVGRKKCEAKWKRLNADEKTAIFDHVPRYVKSTPDDQYRKHPLTYLNGGHWEDEIKLRKEGAEEKPRAGFVLPANFVAARFKMKAQ